MKKTANFYILNRTVSAPINYVHEKKQLKESAPENVFVHASPSFRCLNLNGSVLSKLMAQ